MCRDGKLGCGESHAWRVSWDMMVVENGGNTIWGHLGLLGPSPGLSLAHTSDRSVIEATCFVPAVLWFLSFSYSAALISLITPFEAYRGVL